MCPATVLLGGWSARRRYCDGGEVVVDGYRDVGALLSDNGLRHGARFPTPNNPMVRR
jgi:hypothetical protein